MTLSFASRGLLSKGGIPIAASTALSETIAPFVLLVSGGHLSVSVLTCGSPITPLRYGGTMSIVPAISGLFLFALFG
jgi:hypothetical protein